MAMSNGNVVRTRMYTLGFPHYPILRQSHFRTNQCGLLQRKQISNGKRRNVEKSWSQRDHLEGCKVAAGWLAKMFQWSDSGQAVFYGNSNRGAVAYGVCASFQEEKGLIIFIPCGQFRSFQWAGHSWHSRHSYIHPTFDKDALLFSSYDVRKHPSVGVTNVWQEKRSGLGKTFTMPFVFE